MVNISGDIIVRGVNEMREIKFRAWDGDKLWQQVNSIDFGFLANIPQASVTDKNIVKEINLNTLTLMQYTGLKDKNGVEIYEGDIVSDDGIITWSEAVEWEGNGACFNIDNTIAPSCEVIGNIYENKELLK